MSRSRIKRQQRIARTARVRAAMHPGFTGTLFDIWRRAREIFRQFFERHDCSILQLATREYIWRAEHRKMCDWLCHLEHLVRNLILAAALTLKVTLMPRPSRPRRRQGRRVLVWPDKPSTWRLSFSIFRRASASSGHAATSVSRPPRFARSLPVAHRLEALRRVLLDPQACAHRAALHLARIAAVNRTSNQPKTLAVSGIACRTLVPTRGWQAIASSVETLLPLLDDHADAWNRAPEPG
jgi:hypothetical protein